MKYAIYVVLTILASLGGSSYGQGPLDGKEKIVLETTQGVIVVELMPDVAPKACENFVGLVQKGYYNGSIFHRVIKDFMIQGGDPTGTGRGGASVWGRPFEHGAPGYPYKMA